ncbi:hypothetical protein G7Y79_00047g083360 [Physcia stellaris]|nr:hypothetical protein G7Y79_00047g083360 [Physcia stellaris]
MQVQGKSIEIYAPKLGRTPSHVPILRNSNVEGARDEKPPLRFPAQRPCGVRKLARMQQMQQAQQFPDYSSRQHSSYRPQQVSQGLREARVSQAQYAAAGQRYGQYQRVAQQQAQAGICKPRTVSELVDGVWVTRVVDESPYELVDMPQAQQQLSHFCSSASPPEVARVPESKGPASGLFLETAELGPRAFEATTLPPRLAVEWDPPQNYYSVAGSGDAMISGEEDEAMAGFGEVVEMAGVNSFHGIA